MIVIEHIKYFKVDRDIAEIMQMRPFEAISVITDAGKDYMSSEDLQKEIIRGRRFVRPYDGTDVIIGTSKQVADLINIQWEAWEEMEQRLNITDKELGFARLVVGKLEAKIEYLKLPWWKRLFE